MKWSVIGLSWIHLFSCSIKLESTSVHPLLMEVIINYIVKVVIKIESCRRDGKSNRGNFLFLFFLMLVKLNDPALIRVDSESCRLLAYFGNPTCFIEHYCCRLK